ncbi:hypothetical protein [Actinomycetospora termitidis]|uniref:Uncharacterized protein n=1 Tax=Actinomycetospora termitidis TaxID=3053470 RepID=A0ABT7MFQ4_9PSEU|nr:hypothetical protein [Actinomycetospora sp. Odt1-22]MDL5159505.1 hypothetical protein [Actinomycetospora sp. Odt1-22]
MRLGRRLTAGIAEDPPAPAVPAPAATPEPVETVDVHEQPTPDPVVSGS